MIAPCRRYGIGAGSGWWEDGVQVEALAALAGWVERYDSGEWDDPPGKLALLHDLERVRARCCAAASRFTPTPTATASPSRAT